MTFDELMDRLAGETAPASATQMTSLTNLDGEKLAIFTQRWPDIEPKRRASLLRQLNDLAEDNVELDFEAVYRVALDDDDDETRAAAIDGLWEVEDRRLIPRYVE